MATAKGVPADEGARGLVVLAKEDGRGVGPRVGMRVRPARREYMYGLGSEGRVEVGRVGGIPECRSEERRVAARHHARKVAATEEAVAPDLGGATHRAEPLGGVTLQQGPEQRPRRTPQVPGEAQLAVQRGFLACLRVCLRTYVRAPAVYLPVLSPG